MRVLVVAALASLLTVTGAFAANDGSSLAPGQPAGVHHAQSMDTATLWLLGIGAIAAVAIAGSAGSGGNAPTGTQ